MALSTANAEATTARVTLDTAQARMAVVPFGPAVPERITPFVGPAVTMRSTFGTEADRADVRLAFAVGAANVVVAELVTTVVDSVTELI